MSNRLANESSAYLRQHMTNPVDWYPWGEEAFARARSEDRPLLVSIGYSACHWCHVMEHESFEDPDTSALMNSLFVNVKVDREERPDVDQIYMDTVVRLTGHGGWPLTLFCTPDGRPFYGGTYFPPVRRGGMLSFKEVLTAVEAAYRDRRDEVEATARQIIDALAERPGGVAERPPAAADLERAATQLMQGADLENGGFGGAPKFPTPTSLELLLTAVDFVSSEQGTGILEHCVLTCREMARRGLYDHLGGGFHRYCVDEHWGIPHFEKMLYDQGLLLRVYAETRRRVLERAPDSPYAEELAWPIRETVAYLRREMRAPDGAFHASQDADSEGEEGRFYVWTPQQIDEALGEPSSAAFCEAYGVTEHGNFEGGTTHLIDHGRGPRDAFVEEREALRVLREKRIPPGTDRKRVASWNGYAISGLARSGSLLGDDSLVSDAARAADFVLEKMRDSEGRILRVADDERAKIPAFLDDYAAIVDACLDLHRAGAGDRYLASAVDLAGMIAERFFDADEGDLFLTPSDGERLAHRPRSDHDGATPHATGLAALGLLRAGELSGRAELRRVADSVIRSHAFLVERAPHGLPTLLRAIALAERGLAVAAIVGEPGDPATSALAETARRVLLPEDAVVVSSPGAKAPSGLDPVWLQGRTAVERPTAYLCRGTTCSLPVHEPAELGAALPGALHDARA